MMSRTLQGSSNGDKKAKANCILTLFIRPPPHSTLPLLGLWRNPA